MHVSTPTSYFDCCRVGVDELLAARTDMRAIEGTIEDYALDAEEKDALWLWASGRRERLASDASDRLILGRGAAHD